MACSRRRQQRRQGDKRREPENHRDGLHADNDEPMSDLRRIQRRQSQVGRGDQQRPNGREEHEVKGVGTKFKVPTIEVSDHYSRLEHYISHQQGQEDVYLHTICSQAQDDDSENLLDCAHREHPGNLPPGDRNRHDG